MPAAGEHPEASAEEPTQEQGTRAVVRRIDTPDTAGTLRALQLIQSRTIPGLAPIVRVDLIGDTIEVVERHVLGFTLEEARRPIVDDITVMVALAIVFDVSRALAALHSVDHGGAGTLIHGKLMESAIRMTTDGDTVVTGVEGRVGDPETDVAGVMHLMRRLLEGRAKTKDGALLLDRLSALTFTNCHDLAHAIDVYLQRQEPEQLRRRRARFVNSAFEFLATSGSEEQTAALDDQPFTPLSGDHFAALEPDPDFSKFDDDESLPTIGAADVEDMSEAGSTAVEAYPELGGVLDETVRASPTPLDIAKSREDSRHRPLAAPEALVIEEAGEEETAEADVDEQARAALLARASTAATADAVIVGNYRVVASIGRGGMGEIYLARQKVDSRLGDLVALKVLLAEGQEDEEALGMLLDEAAIMARIEHDNVLRVVDFGKARGRYFLATEYLEGRPLVRVMIEAYNREAGIDYGVIASIGADIANGLFAAHTATTDSGKPLEVVHRDVSPQNIFVTYAGVTKVLDFGVARATERVSKTAVGLVKGKAAYMSPEQAEGLPVDARSDVFSLGICLWEMTAGQRLFKRDNEYDTLLAVQSAPVPSPTTLRGDPNPVLDHIISCALERDLSKRTPTAKELALQLIDYASGVGVVDRQHAVASLLERLFGDASRQERDLIASLELRAATEEEAEELRVLSGVVPRSQVKRLTVIADAEGLGELDDFGTSSSGQIALERSAKSVAQQVIDSVQEVQAERAHSFLTEEPTAKEDVEDPFDDQPTRRLGSDVLDSMVIPAVDDQDIVEEHDFEGTDSGLVTAVADEEPSGDFLPLDTASPPPTAPAVLVGASDGGSRLPIILGLLAGVVLVFAAAGWWWMMQRDRASASPEIDLVAPRRADGPARVDPDVSPTATSSTSTLTTAIAPGTNTASAGAAAPLPTTPNVSVDSFVKLLEEEGVSASASEGTYLVDDGTGGSLVFDSGAKVTRVESSAANGFIVEAKSRALTSVGWVGRVSDGQWRVRGLSINDCPARTQIDGRSISIRYGGEDVRLRHGDTVLTDVQLERPERATRLEVDPLGLSFGAEDETSGAVHCRTGWWGSKVVLRRLPDGVYSLRWVGDGMAKTARLEVAETVVGGKMVRRSR